MAPADFDSAAVIDLFSLPFSIEELDRAINKGKSKSCPGPDGVDYRILKELPGSLKVCLLSILNEFYLSGTFPKEWSQFSIFFIPKKDSNKSRLARTNFNENIRKNVMPEAILVVGV